MFLRGFETHRGVVPHTGELVEVLHTGCVVVLDGEGAGGDVHHGAHNVQDGVLQVKNVGYMVR